MAMKDRKSELNNTFFSNSIIRCVDGIKLPVLKINSAKRKIFIMHMGASQILGNIYFWKQP